MPSEISLKSQNDHNPSISPPKNKGTLFSPTFKIEENKVPLFFGLEIKWRGYGHFEI